MGRSDCNRSRKVVIVIASGGLVVKKPRYANGGRSTRDDKHLEDKR